MSVPFQRPARPSSLSTRLSFALSSHSAEAGLPQEDPRPAHEHIDEIEEIRRYEDFTTIDWVQDAAREQLRRRIEQRDRASAGLPSRNSRAGWRRRLQDSYDAGQAWIVITIIGAAIGLNASFLNIVTEWLSDIKLGHCTTAFYLNENFCCWGAEDGCPEWKRWSSVWPVNYILYILFSILFAYISATLVRSFAPYAAGSGISEIKCILAGFVMKGFLGFWTLLIKSIGLPLAIASGLSVGKEGPSVHYAVCTGNVISRFFKKYKHSAAKSREILSACAAAGVGVAFGSPIGGVLFSLEEMSSNFPLKTMWRSYFCALVATAVLAAMNPFRTGQLVMFQVSYDRDWHFFELLFFVILGAFGGFYGEFVIKWNLRVQAFRKRYLARHAVSEATILAGITAVICYFNMFLRIDMTESMEILFRECEGGHDYNGLCEPSRRWRMIFSLVLATIIRTLLVIISYGSKVPAGIFVPSMAIGAAFGRTVGMLVQALHEASPTSRLFSSCAPDIPCITPGTYAFLGAAAALSGIMHITVSVVVIMFELTGALTYILPTMIVVGVTKAVSDAFGGKGGIADRMIWFNGFPFLDTKDDGRNHHSLHVPVSAVMNTALTVLPAAGVSVAELEHILDSTPYQGFPVCDAGAKLLGFINRSELRVGLQRARRNRGRNTAVPPTARCFFTPPASAPSVSTPVTPGPTVHVAHLSSSSSSSNTTSNLNPTNSNPNSNLNSNPNSNSAAVAATNYAVTIDFARFVDATPIPVHPRLPLETVMEVFKKVGPRVVLVEHRGRLVGIVTRKDVLKFQFRLENRDGSAAREDDAGERLREERVWAALVSARSWVRAKLSGAWERWTRGGGGGGVGGVGGERGSGVGGLGLGGLWGAAWGARRRRSSTAVPVLGEVSDGVDTEGTGVGEVELDVRAR